jgi:hypothetical protein
VHGRRSSHSVIQTSAQELALAKPLKCNVKFVAKSSRLSPTKKDVVAGIEAVAKKMSSTSTTGSGVTHAPKYALNLFDSSRTAPLEWSWKRYRETSFSKDVLKSLAALGIFE